MANTATVTAKFSTAASLTAAVFNNITSFSFDLVNKVLSIEYNNGDGVKRLSIDINASTTFVFTLVAGNYTLTVS